MSRRNVYLPPEITTQILAKLPVKSLLRFRSVCKTWYSLVSCPSFISDHTAQTQTQTLTLTLSTSMLLHHYDTRNRLRNLSFHDESFVECHDHPGVPERLRSLEVEIVGSCDGLICFSKLDTIFELRSFLIWNPSIKKLVETPSIRSTFPILWYLSGFGFDSESRDYKVVRIEHLESSDDQIVAETHILDLRKGVWGSSSSPMMSQSWFVSQPAVYLHGNLHCPGMDSTSPNYFLVSFDLSSEVLNETEMMLDGDPLGRFPRLLLINGLLSVAKVKDLRGSLADDYCIVWSMKEYGVTESWTKLFTIELPYPRNFKIPLRFRENGEVLFVERRLTTDEDMISYYDGGEVLVSYNPESMKSIVLLSTNVGLDACFYKESLVLL